MEALPLPPVGPPPTGYLDIRALYFAVAVVALFFSGAFLLFRFVDSRAKGTVTWGYAYLLVSVAVSLTVFQPLGFLLGRTISAFSLVLATILLDRGIRPATKNTRLLIEEIGLLLAFVIAVVVEFLVVRDPNIADQILIGTLSVAMLRITIHLADRARNSPGQTRMAFVASAVIAALFTAILAVLAVFIPSFTPLAGATEPHPIHTILIPMLMVFLIGAGMSKFWGHYAKIYREAYDAATFDALTGLRNRYYMTPELERNFNKARREGHNLSCIMIDVDHFKKINDVHGHLAGDGVLKALASRIAETVRNYDIVGRFGGEEFLVFEFASSSDAAVSTARRIHEAVRSHEIAGIPVTVSVGVASLSEADTSVDSLLHRADEALYEAKRKGRDRIEIA